MTLANFVPSFFEIQQRGDSVVARFVRDRLTDELNIERMGDELFALCDQFHFRQVVVDMSQVDHVTSSSLGKLITMHRRLHRNGGRLAICSVSDGVNEVLETSRLIDYFNVTDDLDGALALVAAEGEN